MKINRILFDLDGTLWDTQKFHAAAEAALMAEHGVIISPDDLSARFAGRPTEKVFMEVLGCDEDLALTLTSRKWEKIFPTAIDVIELFDIRKLFIALKERGILISIGTASPVQWARNLLRIHDLSEFFDDSCVIGGDMVTHGKPNPEIWIRAAGKTPLENCLVVEDGIAGIEGAAAAGIPCALLLPRKHPKALEISSASDILNFI